MTLSLKLILCICYLLFLAPKVFTSIGPFVVFASCFSFVDVRELQVGVLPVCLNWPFTRLNIL